jgi:hypothetical protein
MIRWAEHVARMGAERKVYKVSGRKSEGKRPLGRPRRRWDDGIRKDLGKNGWGMWSGFNWLRTGPVAGCYKCGDEPSGFGATELVTYDHNYGNSRRPILTIRSISSTSCYSLKYMPQHYGY